MDRRVLNFLLNGKMETDPKTEAKRQRRIRHRELYITDNDPSKEKAKDINHLNNPVKALDESLNKIDRFIKTNFKEDQLLYRQNVMPRFFEKNATLKLKCRTVQQVLKMQELLMCVLERREQKQAKSNIEEKRVSPDGSSCPDNECYCECHKKDTLNTGKGYKGKGKNSQVKNPKNGCKIGTGENMACCCGKPKLPEKEDTILITNDVKESDTEPEVVIETEDVEIQVNVEELKNNVLEEKPKKPRFVSVYLAAPDENTPRYMLAKNIHHKERTQTTYIENKERGVEDQFDSNENKTKYLKNDIQHDNQDTPLNDQDTLELRSSSKLIQVKESDSAHDFSDRDTLLGHSKEAKNSISSDSLSEDGNTWSRGVDTEDLPEEDGLLNEGTVHSDLTPTEFETIDSGIETIDLDSVSEAEMEASRQTTERQQIETEPYDAGTPADISNIRQIVSEHVKGEPIVPKNRGTTIDHQWRLSQLKRIYDPLSIDYSKVKINRHGKFVISRESPPTRSTISSSINS